MITLIPYIFFGTGEIASGVLRELESAGLTPSLIVTSPDRRAGRGNTLTPSPVKIWATDRGIEILQPEKLDADFLLSLTPYTFPLFVVVDYGAFLPKKLLAIPPRGTLNMHPSLLPRLRGPSPIRSAILNDEKETGVSVMLVDEKMDHGPIVAQKKVSVPEWPPHGRELDTLLAREGGKLLAEFLPLWVRGDIEAREQNHDVANFSTMFSKEDGLLDLLNGDPYQNLLKIRAFEGWPGAYAFFERPSTGSGQAPKRIRVQVLDAHLENHPSTLPRASRLIIERVKPEGKGEMLYEEFVRSGAKPLGNG